MKQIGNIENIIKKGKRLSLIICLLLSFNLICPVIPAYAETLDKNDLPDGNYTLTGKLYQTDKKTLSMCNDSLNKTVILTVKNGKYLAALEFKGITIMGLYGYLGSLSYYEKGFSYDKYGNPVGTKASATVLSIHRNSNGSVLVDAYNDAGSPYPKLVQFPLVNKASDDNNLTPLQTTVPIMDAAYPGTGTKDVLLKLDWSTLKEGGNEPVAEKNIPSATDVKVDKSKLKKIIKKAKKIKASEYTALSYKNLKSVLKKSNKVYKDSRVSQTKVNNQVKSLKTAIKDLVKKPAENVKVSKDNAADGKYIVYVDLWHATQDQASMGNASMNRKAIIKVKDNKFIMHISVREMSFGNTTASLESFQVMGKDGNYHSAKVEEKKISGGKPSAYSFTLPSKNTYIPVKVNPKVAVMGNKALDARLKIHWDTFQKASPDEELSDQTEAVSDVSTEEKNTTAGALTEDSGTVTRTDAASAGTSEESSGFLDEYRLLLIHMLGLIAVAAAAATSTVITVKLKLLKNGLFSGI